MVDVSILASGAIEASAKEVCSDSAYQASCQTYIITVRVWTVKESIAKKAEGLSLAMITSSGVDPGFLQRGRI